MALNYSGAKATNDAISKRLNEVGIRIKRARELLQQAQSEITSMQTEYSSFSSEVDTIALAQNTATWDFIKAEKDEMVSDFNAIKQRAADLITAYDSV